MYTYLEQAEDGLHMRPAGEWAAVKLDYLRRYIDVLETSMRDKWTERNYIDLMAGPGKNRVKDTGAILLGSPLLSLTTEYPFTTYYFVDQAHVNTDALKERCSASHINERIRICTGDCNNLIDSIITKIKRTEKISLNLAFLDPEGMELHWETVAKLASIRRMDLIINYPQYSLNRAMKPAFDREIDTAVDRFFGDRSWREVYRKWLVNRNIGLHRQLIDLYQIKLKDLGYSEVRRGDEIGDEPLIRNVKRNAPLYRLLFASKHPLGEKFWHDITRRDIHGQLRLMDSH